MKESEFVSQLDEMKKRGRGLMVAMFAAATAFNLALLYWMFYYRAHASRRSFIISGCVLMAAWLGILGFILFSIKKHVARNAPKCPSCHKPLTGRERDRVLGSKHCPFCQAQIIKEREG